jgi:hypothetical protein
LIWLRRWANSQLVRVLRLAGLIGFLAAAWAAGLEDSGSGASSRVHLYRMTSLSWAVTGVAEAEGVTDALGRMAGGCRTRVELTGRNRGTIVIAAGLHGGVDLTRAPEISASMTLVVDESTCDSSVSVSCAGTYRARGAVIGHFLRLTNGGRSFMSWGHKMDAPEPLPNRSSCGPDLGPPIFQFFYAGLYAPVGGGVFRSPGGQRLVPLPRQRLLAGRRFTTHFRRTIPGVSTFEATATFVPVTR